MSNLSSTDPPPPTAAAANTHSLLLDQLGVQIDPAALSAASTARQRRGAGDRHANRPSTKPPQAPKDWTERRLESNKKTGSSFAQSSSSSSPSSSSASKSSLRRPSASNQPTAPVQRTLDRWDPLKKLPRSTMDRLRFLHAQDPRTFSAGALSTAYGIGYESVKRILRSKFVPSADRARDMDERRARAKMVWRKERAREVRREREGWERSRDKEREVSSSKARSGGRGEKDSTKHNKEESEPKVNWTKKRDDQQAKGGEQQGRDEEGWDWLAKPVAKASGEEEHGNSKEGKATGT